MKRTVAKQTTKTKDDSYRTIHRRGAKYLRQQLGGVTFSRRIDGQRLHRPDGTVFTKRTLGKRKRLRRH